MAKPPHHAGDYQVRAKRVRDAAQANPATRCWRCGLTLDQHRHTRTGKPPRWQAGHVRDGDPTSPLMPEADVCNQTAGAELGNRRRATGYSWP